MTTRDEQFNKDVMKRIQRIHFWKNSMRPFFLESAILAALVGGSAFFVSFQNIMINAKSNPSVLATLKFSLSAFIHTELSVKAVTLAALTLALLVLRDSIFGIVKMTRKFGSLFFYPSSRIS